MVSIKLLSFALLALNIYSGECRAPPTMAELLPKEELPFSIPYPESTSTDSLRCGGILTDSVGLITYKTDNETLLENERCIWTVAVPNTKGYRIYPILIGFEPEEQLLTVSGFTQRYSNVTNLNVVNEGVELTLRNVNLLVITFSSDNKRNNTNSKGFSLVYVGTQDGNSLIVNPTSRHEIVGPDTVHIKHPASGGSYQNYEMSSFVFPPANNVQENHKRNIVLNSLNLETTYDYIDVYSFNSSVSHWVSDGRIYGNTRTRILAANDAMLLVFSSDVSITNTGFDLSTATC